MSDIAGFLKSLTFFIFAVWTGWWLYRAVHGTFEPQNQHSDKNYVRLCYPYKTAIWTGLRLVYWGIRALLFGGSVNLFTSRDYLDKDDGRT